MQQAAPAKPRRTRVYVRDQTIDGFEKAGVAEDPNPYDPKFGKPKSAAQLKAEAKAASAAQRGSKDNSGRPNTAHHDEGHEEEDEVGVGSQACISIDHHLTRPTGMQLL